MKNIIDNINKLSLPAVILIASFMLGGFYFLSQVVEQRMELNERKRVEDDVEFKKTLVTLKKSACVDEAEQSAVDLYKQICEDGPYSVMPCVEGRYLTSNYDSAYERCLSREGLK